MKFWYNDILYCVFKKREELDNHLIKIDRDYVLPILNFYDYIGNCPEELNEFSYKWKTYN